MKKLGIIGGAGPLASALFYQMLIQESYALQRIIPEIVLINYPFSRGLSLDESNGNRAVIQKELTYCINLLAQQGIKTGVLTCNTLHLFLKELHHSSIQFHYLPEMILQDAKNNKHHRLLLLGTQTTCGSKLYLDPEIDLCYPAPDLQSELDAIIDRILEGRLLAEDSELIEHIIRKSSLVNDFEGIILGCTDLPVLHHHIPIRSTKTIYDSIKLSAKTLAGVA